VEQSLASGRAKPKIDHTPPLYTLFERIPDCTYPNTCYTKNGVTRLNKEHMRLLCPRGSETLRISPMTLRDGVEMIIIWGMSLCTVEKLTYSTYVLLHEN